MSGDVQCRTCEIDAGCIAVTRSRTASVVGQTYEFSFQAISTVTVRVQGGIRKG